MKKLLILLVLANSAVYAADWRNPDAPFDASKNRVNESNITWITSKDIQKTCRDEYKRRGFGKLDWAVDACSFWTFSTKTCTIYTKPNPTIHDIGHEMRHCYQGNYH